MVDNTATLFCAACGHSNAVTDTLCGSCAKPLARTDVTISGGATFMPKRQAHSAGTETLSGGRTVGGGGSAERIDDEMHPGLLCGGALRYEIQTKLGEGGMGSVWKAKDKKLGRSVAIKRIRLAGEGDRLMYERFRRETQAIVGLGHPNVVTVYDAGEDEYGPFLVMEFVAGHSLAARLASGPLEMSDAVDLFLGLCRGVAHAHKRGVIHRDIKPGNVMLDEDGVPKLVDFGLVRMDNASDLSLAGQGMGTMDYAAPEQKQDASAVDGRADVYSLGATFYELLTRRRPVPLHVAKVPLQWQGIVGKACEPEATARFQTVDALVAAVDAVRREETVEASLASLQGEDDLKCPSCKLLNTLEARFCRRCGESLRAKCPACDGQLRVGLKHCDHCGANTIAVTQGKKALAEAEAALAEGWLDVVKVHVSEGTQALHGMRLGGATALSGRLQDLSTKRSDQQMRATKEVAQARQKEAEQDFEGALEAMNRAAALDRSHQAARETAARGYPAAIVSRNECRAKALQDCTSLHTSAVADLAAGRLEGARQSVTAGQVMLPRLEQTHAREMEQKLDTVSRNIQDQHDRAKVEAEKSRRLAEEYAFEGALAALRAAGALDSSVHQLLEVAERDYPAAIATRDARRKATMEHCSKSDGELRAAHLVAATTTAEAGRALLSGFEPDRIQELRERFDDILVRIAKAQEEADDLIAEARVSEKKSAFGWWAAIPLARSAMGLDSRHAGYLAKLIRIRKVMLVFLAVVVGFGLYTFARAAGWKGFLGSGESSASAPAATTPEVRSAAAIRGSTPESWYSLGEQYATGKGVPINLEEAIKWYLKAAEADYAPACLRLARMFDTGQGVAVDSAKALALLEQASKLGSPEAMVHLGDKYSSGLGVAKSSDRAERLYRAAADLRHKPAFLRLGDLLRHADLRQAVEYYSAAALGSSTTDSTDATAATLAVARLTEIAGGGDARAMRELAEHFARNCPHYHWPHAKPDSAKGALDWYEKAFKAGDHEAAFELGKIYEEDRIVKRDLQRAREYYEKAARAGNRDAAQALEALRR